MPLNCTIKKVKKNNRDSFRVKIVHGGVGVFLPVFSSQKKAEDFVSFATPKILDRQPFTEIWNAWKCANV